MSKEANRFSEPQKYANVAGRKVDIIVDRQTRVQ